MRRRIAARNAFALLTVALTSPAPGIAQEEKLPPSLVARTEARTPDEERKGFHLPPGFEIELVACEPDIHKPMNLSFDDRGRLWVTSSLEYPFPAGKGV